MQKASCTCIIIVYYSCQPWTLINFNYMLYWRVYCINFVLSIPHALFNGSYYSQGTYYIWGRTVTIQSCIQAVNVATHLRYRERHALCNCYSIPNNYVQLQWKDESFTLWQLERISGVIVVVVRSWGKGCKGESVTTKLIIIIIQTTSLKRIGSHHLLMASYRYDHLVVSASLLQLVLFSFS